MASVRDYLPAIEHGGEASAHAAAELAHIAFVKYMEAKGDLDDLNRPDDLAEFVQVATAYSAMKSSAIQMEASILRD